MFEGCCCCSVENVRQFSFEVCFVNFEWFLLNGWRKMYHVSPF